MKTEIKANSHAELVRLTQQTLAEVGLDIPFERLDTRCGVSCDEFTVNYRGAFAIHEGKMYDWYEAYIFIMTEEEKEEALITYTHELAQKRREYDARELFEEYYEMMPTGKVKALFRLWEILNGQGGGEEWIEIYNQLGHEAIQYFAKLVVHNQLIHENEGKLSQLKWKITLGEYKGEEMLTDLPKELWYLPLAWQEVYEICKAHDFYTEAYDLGIIRETFKSPLCVLDLEEVMELAKDCWLYNTEIELEFYDCDDDEF